MSHIALEDVRLHFRTQGSPSQPCVVLSNSLGTDLEMWDAQAEALARDYYVLRYDARGHGLSTRGSAPVTLERLGRDVVGLLDALHISDAHFCGISMGGLTGQWLAIHQPKRINKLVLANTAARIGTSDGWAARAAQVRSTGMDSVADGAAARWFTSAFIGRAAGTVDGMIARLRAQDAEGYAACCDALAVADLREAVATITAPTLILAGEHDPVTTLADGAWMAERIQGARLDTVPASHLSNIEAQETFTQKLRQFLAD
jgi:3-oxoadipate enol-lactonase